MHKGLIRHIVMLLGLLLGNTSLAAADKLTVFVSIAPQREMVQQIGKNRVDVHVMVHPGASPATYEPKPRQMAALARAAVYFSIGVPFEDVWLEKFAAANQRMKIVATDRGVEKHPMAASYLHEDDRHGHATHADRLDPHIWTSPPLVLQLARHIMEALQQQDPAHEGEYEANYQRFKQDIRQLHEELQETFADMQEAVFMTFHPSWGYFARTYGLRQISIEVEGKAPKPSQLSQVIKIARKQKIKAIFVQPQFSAKSAGLIAKAVGARVIAADPLAEDWAANLRRQAMQFKAALR